jgi:hypothetical protein
MMDVDLLTQLSIILPKSVMLVKASDCAPAVLWISRAVVGQPDRGSHLDDFKVGYL